MLTRYAKMVFDYINTKNKDGEVVTLYVLSKDLPIPYPTLVGIMGDLRDRSLVNAYQGTVKDRWGSYGRGKYPNTYTISKRGKLLLSRKKMALQVNDLIMGDQVKVAPECLNMVSTKKAVVATVTRRLTDKVIINYGGVRYEISPDCLTMFRKYHQ